MDTKQKINTSSYQYIIVGAGVYGLSIAYYLSKHPNIRTLLIEQYQIGHHNGSSHSPTRITRSVYDKQLYRDLNTKGLKQNWKQLQSVLNCKLVYQAPYIYFDHDQKSYQQYKKVTEGHENFEIIPCEQVSTKYFPMPLIKTKFHPIVDKKSGILAAGQYIAKLKQYLLTKCSSNVTVLENTQIYKINQISQGVEVQTKKGLKFNCLKVILSSGKWVSTLMPQIKDHFKVVKQYVAYLQLKDMQKYSIEKFNSFYFRYTEDVHFYCLPDHNSWGVKFAKHAFQLKPQQDNIQFQSQFLHQKAKEIFGDQFIRIRKIQNCYYTFTPTEDFILDYVDPVNQKILVCSCCSGHGFKFAPIIGDITAQLLTKGRNKDFAQDATSNEVYNKWKHMWKFAYQQGINLH